MNTNTNELIDTLKEAQHEIRSLRRQNELLSAKVDTFESAMLLLRTEPAGRHLGMSPDVVFAMEKRIMELEAAKTQPTKSSEDPWTCFHCNQLNAAWATECGRCTCKRQ